jgi:O-acetylhomoserine/O-acetylserine sulfhydrylase-like pyridoxal-dependent enzyme
VLPVCFIALSYGLINVYGTKYIHGHRCKPCHRKDIGGCIQSQGERERERRERYSRFAQRETETEGAEKKNALAHLSQKCDAFISAADKMREIT